MRARLRPERPRPCSVAMKRISCARASFAGGVSPAIASSCATSRRYALRVCAGRAARCVANAPSKARWPAATPASTPAPRAGGVLPGARFAVMRPRSRSLQVTRDRHARELGEAQQVDGAHRAVETLRLLAPEREHAERLLGAKRQVRERLQRLAAVEPLARLERRLASAVGRTQPVRVFANADRRRPELR